MKGILCLLVVGLLVLAYAFLTYRRSHGDGRTRDTVANLIQLGQAAGSYYLKNDVYPEGDAAEVIAVLNAESEMDLSSLDGWGHELKMLRYGRPQWMTFYSVGENGVDEKGEPGTDDIILALRSDFELSCEVDPQKRRVVVRLRNDSDWEVYVELERECFAGAFYDETGRDYHDARYKPTQGKKPLKMGPGNEIAWILASQDLIYEKYVDVEKKYFDAATMQADRVELSFRARRDGEEKWTELERFCSAQPPARND
ncbi:hypothetical protein [Rubritalea halochordaticola]